MFPTHLGLAISFYETYAGVVVVHVPTCFVYQLNLILIEWKTLKCVKSVIRGLF